MSDWNDVYKGPKRPDMPDYSVADMIRDAHARAQEAIRRRDPSSDENYERSRAARDSFSESVRAAGAAMGNASDAVDALAYAMGSIHESHAKSAERIPAEVIILYVPISREELVTNGVSSNSALNHYIKKLADELTHIAMVEQNLKREEIHRYVIDSNQVNMTRFILILVKELAPGPIYRTVDPSRMVDCARHTRAEEPSLPDSSAHNASEDFSQSQPGTNSPS